MSQNVSSAAVMFGFIRDIIFSACKIPRDQVLESTTITANSLKRTIMNRNASLTVRPNPNHKYLNSKPKPKNSNRNRVYGVNKNSLSRSVTDLTTEIETDVTSAPRKNSLCYVTPKSVTPIPSPCPDTERGELNEEQTINLKYKFIKAVKEIMKTRQQSAHSRLEYAKMRQEKQVSDHVGQREIIIVGQDNENEAKLQREPTITSFPFVADEGSDEVDGQPCLHDKCLEAKVTPVSRTGARLCMLQAVAQMKILASKRPKTIVELKRSPITTAAHEKLLRDEAGDGEQVKSDQDDSDSESEGDPVAYLRGCRYLRGVREDKELSIDEIFH